MRRMLILCSLVATAGLAFAAPKGKNLKETEEWIESEKLIQQSEKSAGEACGVKLSLTYDASSFGTMALAEAKPADVYCRDAFNTLWGSVCHTPTGKATVQAKVSAVSCRFSKDGTKVTLEGKTLVIHVDPKNKKIDGFVPGPSAWATIIKTVL